MLAAYETESPAFTESFEAFKVSQVDSVAPLILLQANTQIWETEISPNDLRASEKELIAVTSEYNEDATYLAVYDLRVTTRL